MMITLMIVMIGLVRISIIPSNNDDHIDDLNDGHNDWLTKDMNNY